jgi:2,5-dichlorohydroquinone reductive dechlorinase
MIEHLASLTAQARLALRSDGQAFGDSGPSFRFELFHAAPSICAQKVRTVLMHHCVPFISHLINLFEGQSYLPDYVRLRMVGCDALGGTLASCHNGSTSTASTGCDGAVVPTLVDSEAQKVLVDSMRICIYIDELAPSAQRLRPAALTAQIDDELVVIDNLPNYQMLMMRKNTAPTNKSAEGMVAANFSKRKVEWCDAYLTKHASDPVLVRAYQAKRAKELSAAEKLFSSDALENALAQVRTALARLDRKLEQGSSRWMYGSLPTMADLFWGIELLRMRNIGFEHLWHNQPRISAFLAEVEQLPSIRSAIIDWPGAMY